MRPEKRQLALDIQELIQLSPSLFLVTYRGLSAGELEAFRDALAEVGAECHVVPNRIFRIAARQAGVEELCATELRGDTALICNVQDPAAVAKALKTFGKEHEAVTAKVGWIDGQLADPAEVATLADLPPKEVLQAQFLSVLLAPAEQLARVLQAKVASIVYVLSAYQREQESAAS